ncbi:MAG: ATP-binding protein [Candidatus Kerfeldbacteria bacterium]|nr:ATP-binding protein [Candidatus Kerfeldbacteria bacterium]
MIIRSLETKLKQLAKQMPAIAVIGPRQSGKTTLVRKVFSNKPYVSLEDLDVREFAAIDPRGFLAQYQAGAIFDEIQRVPDLLSYVQTMIDHQQKNGQFILTGSHNYLLQQHISQTLAGRVAMLTLLPLSVEELVQANPPNQALEQYLFSGSYPRIYDQKLDPTKWYQDYIQTYIERDVRLIKNISNLHAFQKFIKLCAGRIGQILNLSSLANDCGITHNTAKAWLSVLESSYLVFLLQPHHKNFSKRLIKMPKLYFYDTGLAAALLNITSLSELKTHYLYGSLFESFVITELMKKRFNAGLQPNCYFWRDRLGHEIDCILDQGEQLIPIEIKSGKTITADYFKGLQYWTSLAGLSAEQGYVIYAGTETQKRKQGRVLSWQQMMSLTK